VIFYSAFSDAIYLLIRESPNGFSTKTPSFELWNERDGRGIAVMERLFERTTSCFDGAVNAGAALIFVCSEFLKKGGVAPVDAWPWIFSRTMRGAPSSLK